MAQQDAPGLLGNGVAGQRGLDPAGTPSEGGADAFLFGEFAGFAGLAHHPVYPRMCMPLPWGAMRTCEVISIRPPWRPAQLSPRPE